MMAHMHRLCCVCQVREANSLDMKCTQCRSNDLISELDNPRVNPDLGKWMIRVRMMAKGGRR